MLETEDRCNASPHPEWSRWARVFVRGRSLPGVDRHRHSVHTNNGDETLELFSYLAVDILHGWGGEEEEKVLRKKKRKKEKKWWLMRCCEWRWSGGRVGAVVFFGGEYKHQAAAFFFFSFFGGSNEWCCVGCTASFTMDRKLSEHRFPISFISRVFLTEMPKKKNCPANHGLDYVNPIAEGVSIGRSLNRLPTRVLVAHLSRVPPEFFQDKTKTTERVTFFPFSECMSLARLSAADKEQLQVCERESPCVK